MTPSDDTQPAAPPARTVEWYRADQSRRIAVVAAAGCLLVMLGCLLVGLALGHVFHAEWAWLLGVLGGGLVVAGPLTVIGGFHALLAADITLVVRTDGVHYRDGGQEVHVAWEELVEARGQDGGVLELVRRGQPPLRLVRPFYGFSPRELATRLNDLRRKAAFNLLPR